MRSCLFLFYLTLKICNFLSCNVRGGKTNSRTTTQRSSTDFTSFRLLSFSHPALRFYGCRKAAKKVGQREKNSMSGVVQGALRANKVWVTEHTAFGSLRKDVGVLLFFFDLFSFEGSHMPFKEKAKQQQKKQHTHTQTTKKDMKEKRVIQRS